MAELVVPHGIASCGQDSTVDLDESLEINAICEEFEGELCDGRSPRIEDYCIENERFAPRLLRELINLELAYQWKHNPSFRPNREDYHRRFPSCREDVGKAIATFQELHGIPPERWVGPYELLDRLGRGGQGVVYRAQRYGLDGTSYPVALKLILPALLASQEAVGRFVGDVRAMARLDHRGIIPTFDSGEDRGQPYVAMKLVGPSLDRVLQERRRLGIDEAVRLVIEIARAVDYLHQHGYVHCDLKPSNILLDGDQPLITDFGLSRFLEPDPQPASMDGRRLKGTIPYMAPEQLRGEPCRASDIYSLGAILFELLTGRRPFGSGPRAIQRILDEEVRGPRHDHPGFPAALDAIIRKCLRKEPSTRYESAAQLAAELERFQLGQPLPHTPADTRIEKLVRWVSLHRELTTRLIAIGAVLALTQFNYFVVLKNPDHWIHAGATGVELIWIAASIAFDRPSRTRGSGESLRAPWIAVDVVLLTVLLRLLNAVTSTSVMGYPLLIAISGLWARGRLVWLTTALCLAGYAALVSGHKGPGIPWTYGTQDDDPNIALVIMVVTGYVVALQVQKTCTALNACQIRRIEG
jgi:serine/threonine protein kinase